MSKGQPERRYARPVEVIATIAIVIMIIGVIAPIIGVNGLRLTDRPDLETAAISVEATPRNGPMFDDIFPTIVDDSGRTTVFGQAPVRLASEVTATVEFLDPTASQRVIWLIWQVSGPLLGIAIAWTVRQLAASARAGDPFTTTNERRVWRLALLVATGGTVYSVFSGMAQTLLVQRSAAADLFAIEFSVEFLPIVAGVVLGALASVWRVGVQLRDDASATI